jgi:GNAT superfamily N-acetyltransferase
MIALRFSPLESARFGLRVFRAEGDEIDGAALAGTLKSKHVDIAILRLPPQVLGSLQTLREHELIAIVADTRVTYDIALPAAIEPADESVRLVPALPSDVSRLQSLVRDVFAGYVTHYHANPLLRPDDILNGYVEWASSYVRAGRAGDIASLVESRGKIAGFSCCAFDSDSGVATGVLNGIIPAERGRGVYRAMLRRMLHDFSSRGAIRFVTATQVQNLTVQRVWTNEGFVLRSAANTVHLNALFGRNASAASEGDDAPAVARGLSRI